MPVLLSLLFLAILPGDTPIRGYVLDAADRSPLVGASVEIIETGQGATTDRTGAFALRLAAPGEYTLRVRFLGYETRVLPVSAPADELVIALEVRPMLIDEVVVTGSPIGSTVRYQAVMAYGREQLDRRSAAALGEVLDGSPGLAMRSMGPAPARPVIRGFDGDRVVVLENGERSGDLSETAADHALASDPVAADRVEVVRGPASLLYGSGAIGGVINILTDDIPQAWEPGWSGDVALHGSTVNSQAAGFGRLRYGAGNWLLGGRLAARGAGDVRTPEGLLPGTDLRNVDGAIGGALRSGRFVGGLSATAAERTYGLPEAFDDPDERVEIRMQRQTLRAEGRWALDGFIEGIELRAHGGRYAHDEFEMDPAGEELGLRFDQRFVSTTLIARHGPLGPAIRGAFGLSAFARDLHVGGAEALTPDGTALRLAGFLFEEVPLTHLIAMQVAARAEGEFVSVRPNELFPDASDARRSLALSAAAGLNARPLRGLELGLQVAQAFRAPTFEERYSDAAHLGAGAYEIGDPDLGFERALGLDAFTRIAAGPLNLEVALFTMRIRDFVVYQPTGETHAPSGLPIFVYEADAAVQWGGEATLAFRPTADLRLVAGTDFVRGSRADGTPLPRIPPVRGLLAVELEQGSWWAGARTRAVAAQHRTAPYEEPTPGYLLMGLEGGLRLGPARQHLVSLRVDNLFDVAYRDHLSRVEFRNAPMPGRNLSLMYRVMW